MSGEQWAGLPIACVERRQDGEGESGVAAWIFKAIVYYE